MTLAYIGPGPGWLLDPHGPWVYLLGVGVLALAWVIAGRIRDRRGEGNE